VESPLARVYRWASFWSRIGVLATLGVVGTCHILFGEINLSLQLVIALIALLVGIPHGAIDHLISMPRKPDSRFVAYIVIYTLVAVIAGWMIATWNINGFRVVLLMSALHFGFGDASFKNEQQDARKLPRFSFLTECLFALPAGFLPVMLPMTDGRTLSALTRIHPHLQSWSGDHLALFRQMVLVLMVFSLIALILLRRYQLVLDLLLLAALSTVAPPLVAFAAYFGFWHALRHTARLVPKLPKAHESVIKGDWRKAITQAVIPGLYALIGTLLVAGILMYVSPDKFSSSLLWSTLLIVWALTVPHMMVTARFDLKVMGKFVEVR
jgi:beta-carotene 15,15'-dioxygenase